MNIQFKKGVIELCIFSLVANNELYAYELIKLLCKSVKVSEGALYPLLRQLTLDGYLETYFKDINGEAKKYYRLTSKGFEAKDSYLSEWLDLTNRVNELIKED